MAPQRQMAPPSAPDVGRKDEVLCMDTCSLTLRPKTYPEQGFWGAWPRLGEGGRGGTRGDLSTRGGRAVRRVRVHTCAGVCCARAPASRLLNHRTLCPWVAAAAAHAHIKPLQSCLALN